MNPNKMRKKYHKMAKELREHREKTEALEASKEHVVAAVTAPLREELRRAQELANKEIEATRGDLTKVSVEGQTLAQTLEALRNETAATHQEQVARIEQLTTELFAAKEIAATAQARIDQAHAYAAEQAALAQAKVVDMKVLFENLKGVMKKKHYEQLNAIENRKVLSGIRPHVNRG